MNLLPGAARRPGPVARARRRSVPLPSAPAGAACGRTLTAASGPRRCSVATEPDGAGTLPARIAHVEHLGHETLVHLLLADDESTALVARVAGMPALAAGQAVGLIVDPAQIALFDTEGRLAP